MHHEPPFGLIHELGLTKTHQTQGYPIDVELRRAFRARRGALRGFSILRARTARRREDRRDR